MSFAFLLMPSAGINVFADCTSVPFSRSSNADDDVPFDQLRDLEIKDRHDLDITHVTFSSDGNMLNAKIWLDELPKNQTSSWLTYGIAIDSDLDPNTGDSGADYGYYYEYIGDTSLLRDYEDPTIKSNTWYSVVAEFVSTNKYIETRSPVEFTDFSDGKNPIINFSIDFDDIGNCPEKYGMLFSATDYKAQQYDIVDNTEWIEIPPPKFTLYSNPPELTLVPGEEQSVEMVLENTSALDYRVTFSMLEQPKNQLEENIEVILSDAGVERVLPANSLVTTHIDVKSPLAVNSKIAYTVGVSAKIQGSDDLLEDYVQEHGTISPNLSSYYTDSPEILNTSFSVTLLSTWDALWLFLQRIEVILGIMIAIAGVMGVVRKFFKKKTN